ncbi:hypothetical protein BASA81_018133 [Batrachochytrium salamandrivorans]|nr:hypothetical protein BASA81_018133 [Batrachochytrium salamandrivorans]
MDPMSRYTLSTTHPTPAAQLTPDCPVSDFSGLSVLPDTSPEPPIHSPTIPENFENFHFFHDFDPPGMVSDDSESMVPLGDHLTSPVKILTRSLIIHGHVSKLENFPHPAQNPVPPTLLYASRLRDRPVALAQSHFSIPSSQIISWNINGLVSKRNDLREHIAEVKPLLLMLQETNLDTNAFRFTAPKYSFIQHPASGPGKRGIALGFLAVLPAREIEGVPGTLILAKVPGLTEQQILQYQSNTVGCIEQPPRRLSAEAKNAYRAWLASRDSILSPQETIQGKYNQYILAEATASRLTKQDDRLRWRSHCTRIDNLLAGGCAKQAWNAAKRMACASGHSCRSSNPIRNEEGVLQFQPISICNTLRSHYMRLAEAGEGHSLDPTHWETMPQPPQHIPPSSTLSMDLPFSLRELDHALGSMHPRKAPGDDGITTALMQAIAHDPKDHGTGDVNLDRPGALALLRVANTIFLSGVIPKVWRCATIISIPKKGDATLASNLRGISLINVGLKILCKMVQARLSSLLESNNVLVPEQGLSQEHHPRGLMFADDIAIIAPSHESLCTSMGTIADWATRWEMSFGVAKCATPTQTQLTHPIQLHGIDLPSVSQYEYLGVIIDDLLNLSPWLVKKKRAITAAVHSISPLLRNNSSPTRYRLTIFNGLVLGVAYYGLELIGGNSTLARRLQAPVNTGIRMILKAPLFTPIAPMLTDCGIISLDAHAILARLKHQPIHPKHPIHYTPESLLHPLLSPLPQPSAEIRHQRSKYALERTFQVWGKSKLACSYVQANHASSAKFLRSPALSTGQAIGASLLSLARCGGLWDYPRALKAGLLHPTATNPDQLGSPSRRQSALLTRKFPGQAQDTVEENPTGSRTTTTDTHTAAISSTPTPTHISYIGSDDILTVLLGGSLPGTNNAGNTEACPGQQWLTGTVEEGNLLSSNQPVAHRMCDFLQISVRVYRAMLWKHHKSNLSHIPDI